MKIDFTKREYRLLLELLYLGEWMIDAHETETRPETVGYRELQQKLYKFAKELDAEDLIEYSRELGEYFPTNKLGEAAHIRSFIEEYDNNSFWQELIHRLVDRDLQAQVGEDELRRMDFEEYLEKSIPIEETYSEEFTRYDLERVRVGSTRP